MVHFSGAQVYAVSLDALWFIEMDIWDYILQNKDRLFNYNPQLYRNVIELGERNEVLMSKYPLPVFMSGS